MSPARRSILWAVLFVALWADIEGLGGSLHGQYTGYQVVWTRYAVHLGFMFLLWGWREPRSLWRTTRPAFQLARSMLMLGMPVSLLLGMGFGADSGAFMSVFWIAPILILVFARWFLGERANPLVWLATLTAFSAAVLIAEPRATLSPITLALAVCMALTLSLYVVMTRSLRTERTRTNLFLTALGVFVALTPLMPLVWVMPGPHDLLILAAIGVLGFVALLALDRMAAASPVSLSAPVIYLQVAFAVADTHGVGHLFLGRRVPAAASLILLITAFIWYRGSGLVTTDAA